jgi:hypothetical protein
MMHVEIAQVHVRKDVGREKPARTRDAATMPADSLTYFWKKSFKARVIEVFFYILFSRGFGLYHVP